MMKLKKKHILSCNTHIQSVALNAHDYKIGNWCLLVYPDTPWVLVYPAIRCFDFPKIYMMSRIIMVIIQNSLYQNKNREEVKNREIRKIPDLSILTSSLFLFWYKEFWIITLIILLIIYILGKSIYLIMTSKFTHITVTCNNQPTVDFSNNRIDIREYI